MTLVDTNILIDLASLDPVWLPSAKVAFARRASLGPMQIVDVVFAEFAAGFESERACRAVLDRFEIDRVAMASKALWLAGRAFRTYRSRGGLKTNVLPDFFIGAQAMAIGIPLLTRDTRLYQFYFPEINLLVPKA